MDNPEKQLGIPRAVYNEVLDSVIWEIRPLVESITDSRFIIKSTYLCLYLSSLSDMLCHLSGMGLRDLDKSWKFFTRIVFSPLFVVKIGPFIPIMSLLLLNL